MEMPEDVDAWAPMHRALGVRELAARIDALERLAKRMGEHGYWRGVVDKRIAELRADAVKRG